MSKIKQRRHPAHISKQPLRLRLGEEKRRKKGTIENADEQISTEGLQLENNEKANMMEISSHLGLSQHNQTYLPIQVEP